MTFLSRILWLSLVAAAWPCLADVQPPPTAVSVRTLSELGRPTEHAAAAEVRPRNDSWLAAEVAAVVARVEADVGDAVGRGDLLVQLDDRDAQLTLDQARAQRRAAEADLQLASQRRQRGLELRANGHVSADEALALETVAAAAAAQLDIAKAGERGAQRQLQKTRVTAPFDGAVMERQAQVGQLAAPGTPLLRLVDRGPGEVVAALPAEWAESVRTAQSIWFETQAGDRLALATPSLTDPIDSASRTRRVRLAFVDQAAPPGSAGRILIRTDSFQLPADVVVERDNQQGVFVIDGNSARFHPVAGFVEGRSVQLALPGTTRIVVSGQRTLRDGQAVQVEGAR